MSAWRSVTLVAVVAVVAGCGGGVETTTTGGGRTTTSRGAATATTATTQSGQRGVFTIAAELAPHCVDRLGTAESGKPATPEIASLVDELVSAYEAGPKNEATTSRVRVALDNMESGCGPDQADKIRAALERQGESPADEQAAAPPRPQAPPVRVLTGFGSRVRTVRLSADSPLVVTGSHQGQSNFIVDLVGRGQTSGSENLFNEIGNFSGQTAVEEAASGRYRVKVQADGPWTLRFAQPVPSPGAKKLPGTLRGNGAKVRAVSTTEDLQPVITGTHRGEANFIVDIIGYGDTSGSENLFNEIGRFNGETLLEEMPQGDYLVHVQADGPWTLRFTR
jgi:hypothetical protein